MPEIEFSSKTKRAADPHQWKEADGQVMVDGRVLWTMRVWLCGQCQLASGLPPRFIRSEDLGKCNEIQDD